MVEIEDNIPMPAANGRPVKYPWKELAVGQSFFVAGINPKSVRRCANIQQREGRKFATRCIDGGIRVWRIE